MLGKTHFVFALFLCTFFNESYLWFILLIASLLPDIDTKKSLLGRRVKVVGNVFEHRGFFHSLFFFIPGTFLVYSLSATAGIAFAIGIMSHLFLDMCTKQGLRIYPFKKKIKGFIKVGSLSESLIRISLFFLFIVRLLSIWLQSLH